MEARTEPEGTATPGRAARAVAFSGVIALTAATTVWVLLADSTPSLLMFPAVAGAMALLASAGARGVGPGAARAAAFAFAALLPWLLAAAYSAQDRLLVGPGEWCGTGRLSAAMNATLLAALASGVVCAVAVLRTAAPPSAPRAWQGVALLLVGVAALASSVAGLVSAASRPQAVEVRPSLRVHAQVEGRRVEIDPAPSQGPEDVEVRSLIFDDGDASASRVCARGSGVCTLAVDLRDGLGPRRSAARFEETDSLRLLRDDARTIWAAQLLEGERWTDLGGVVRGAPGDLRSIDVHHVRGRVGADLAAIALGALGSLVLLASGLGLLGTVARLRALRRGVEGMLGADGWVDLAGAERAFPVDVSLGLQPGPVVALTPPRGHDYRATIQHRGALFAGTKASQEALAAVAARDAIPVRVVAAAILIVPLVAAALLGTV